MTDDEYHGYLKGNVLKYVARYKFKGEPLQDLEKANWYLGRLIMEVKQMSHGEKMSLLGKIIALQEVMIHIQKEINKLNKQLKEVEDGSSKTSSNRSRYYGLWMLKNRQNIESNYKDLRTEFNKKGGDNPYLLDEELIENKYYQFRGAE